MLSQKEIVFWFIRSLETILNRDLYIVDSLKGVAKENQKVSPLQSLNFILLSRNVNCIETYALDILCRGKKSIFSPFSKRLKFLVFFQEKAQAPSGHLRCFFFTRIESLDMNNKVTSKFLT